MSDERQDLVEALFDDTAARDALREVLKSMPDFARLCKKFKRKQASLQDVVRVYQALLRLPDLVAALERVQEMRVQGDAVGLDRWQAIYAAICDLRRSATQRLGPEEPFDYRS